MPDMNAMRIIEALRSGVPSRAVGKYFAEARPKLIRRISDALDEVAINGKSDSFLYTGKYGEGKTHLLNTAMTMAQENDMVVSYMPISKEAPFDKLPVIYRNIVQNTYLPKHEQPGFLHKLWGIGASSPLASEMLLYAAKELETDKLYYLFQCFLKTDDQEEQFRLQADLEGDFISPPDLKRIYRRIAGKAAKMNVPFSKTKHCMDYFSFLSRLVTAMGYNGWVILIDEVELIGRTGKKARQNAYRNMYRFLKPTSLHATYTMFAVSSMYQDDVIEKKHEYENLEAIFPNDMEPGKTVLDAIVSAEQLNPLTRDEISEVISRIIDFHAKAYDWKPDLDVGKVVEVAQEGGSLLRTKLRSAIEYLDQKYLYGDGGHVSVGALEQEDLSAEEADVPSLDDLND
ncbi:MAG: DUF2791 family P-loop domain-containing protein [Clostridia bacterium]|nr:DUF2791 family P-loop domain-containing protein [Clostridia bacterium]